MILSFQRNNEQNLNDKIINNILKLIQESKANNYNIKEENYKLKVYVNDVNNIDETIDIVERIIN